MARVTRVSTAGKQSRGAKSSYYENEAPPEERSAARLRIKALFGAKPDDKLRPGTERMVPLDPPLAADMLMNNEHNRGFSWRKQDEIDRDLAAGRWDAHVICQGYLDEEAYTMDIAHRARAVVNTGVTIPNCRLTVIPRESQDFLDLGTPRDFADTLQIEGGEDSSIAPGLQTFIRRLMHNEISMVSTSTWSLQELKGFYLANSSALRESLNYGRRAWAMFPKGSGVSITVLAEVHYYVSALKDKYGDDACNGYLESIEYGSGLRPGSWVLQMRNRLISNKDARGGKIDTNQIRYLLRLGWDIWNNDPGLVKGLKVVRPTIRNFEPYK